MEGIRKPDAGDVTVLGMDPRKEAYKIQDRIGVQLQEAQLQKRIKVWEAVDLWASLYPRCVDTPVLLAQLGLTEKRNATVDRTAAIHALDFLADLRVVAPDLLTGTCVDRKHARPVGRPPAQKCLRSSLKPPWCASWRPPTETLATTFP